MTKILLVEDESIVRKGIALSIDWAEYGAEITDEASNGEEALKKMPEHSAGHCDHRYQNAPDGRSGICEKTAGNIAGYQGDYSQRV